MVRGVFLASSLFALTAVAPTPSRGQEPIVAEGVVADTVRIEGEALTSGTPSVYTRYMVGGDRIAAWVENEVEIGRPELEGVPVPDARLGAVVARFEGSGVFEWPERPFVWTAPRTGRLVFGINASGIHEARGHARVIVVPLIPPGGAAFLAFPAPRIELERVPGGVLARYADRAGFGVVPSTLRIVLTTSHGVEHRLAPWTTPGDWDTFLPLPPPGITLPAGVHSLSATVQDWIGNAAPSARLTFDSP